MNAVYESYLASLLERPQNLSSHGLDIIIQDTEGNEALTETRRLAIEIKLERELCS